MNLSQNGSIKNKKQLSIILATFNESQNILKMLHSIDNVLPSDIDSEIIVVDDNSPDGTGTIVENYIKTKKNEKPSIRVIHRMDKRGLSSAIIEGLHYANGEMILVMDTDFAHPPEKILEMLDEMQNNHCDIVVGSRFVKGSKTVGWPFSRKLMSSFATKITEYGLGLNVKDSTSGFFLIKKNLIENKKFDAIGSKLLLEILVKIHNAKIKEIPYTCINREFGSSKFNISIILDYFKLVKRLYKYKKSHK